GIVAQFLGKLLQLLDGEIPHVAGILDPVKDRRAVFVRQNSKTLSTGSKPEKSTNQARRSTINRASCFRRSAFSPNISRCSAACSLRSAACWRAFSTPSRE